MGAARLAATQWVRLASRDAFIASGSNATPTVRRAEPALSPTALALLKLTLAESLTASALVRRASQSERKAMSTVWEALARLVRNGLLSYEEGLPAVLTLKGERTLEKHFLVKQK